MKTAIQRKVTLHKEAEFRQMFYNKKKKKSNINFAKSVISATIA